MPEPDEIQFDCIGCGTMNPANAEVCSGCGHRFAGPGEEPPQKPVEVPVSIRPVTASEFPEFRYLEEQSRFPRHPVEEPSLGVKLLRSLGYVLIVLLSTAAILISLALALTIAFFTICGGGSQVAGFGFGLVVAIVVLLGMIGLLLRVLREPITPGRGKFP